MDSEYGNNQDNLAETLQSAYEADGFQTPAESQSRDDSDFGSIDQRSRKKQKMEPGDYKANIDKLHQEIAEAKKRLDTPHNLPRAAWELGKNCIDTKQIAATMGRKLAEHAHWLQRVSSLMESAPLFDYDGQSGDEQKTGQADGVYDSQPSLDEWRVEAKARSHPRLILDERMRAAVAACQENASRLLHDATQGDPSFHLSLEFESRGWKIAAGLVMNDNVGFSCHRVLPPGLSNKTREVAMTLWNSVESDEIFRTFMPLVQDSIIIHQEAKCSLSCRVVQLSQEASQQAVATVESISSSRDGEGEENSWQISMEVVHDYYLCTFAADASGDSGIQNTAPPLQLDLGLQMSKLNMHNKFVMGAQVTKTNEGVDILIAGSARFDLPCYRDPAFDLLNHFVSHMPVYEALHLTPLGNNDKQDCE
ncbi:hypothetical protein PRNP1_014197 [Phytophthora ramorum]